MIRTATTEDIPEIMLMARSAFPETYREILSKEQIEYMMDMMYSERSLIRQMTAENNIFHIIDGKGYASYRYDGQTDDNADIFHLEKLYVLPEFQGKGVGKQLFDSVVKAVRERSSGHIRLELNVNRYNKALSFYEHIGMRRDRQGDFPIGGGFYMNDYIMVMDLHSQTALVTGAGKGIGRQYAQQLADRGYNLILVGRSDSVTTAAREIQSSHPDISVKDIIMDLSNGNAADELYRKVKDNGRKVDVLINNAGMFTFRDTLEIPAETVRKMLTLHNITLTRMCQLFGQEMALSGGGHILNMSSYSVWMPLPGMSLYGASKSYIKFFSAAFSKEVREKGVYVTAVCPAAIATDLYGLSPKYQKIGVRIGVVMTPELCAKRALRALFAHKRYSVPGWWNRIFIPFLPHIPNWAEKIIRRETVRFQK